MEVDPAMQNCWAWYSISDYQKDKSLNTNTAKLRSIR